MTVVTFSRQLGSRGEEIAKAVAQGLSLRLIDAATINQAAQQAGVPEVALAELEHEGARDLANQMLKALRTMPGLPIVAPAGAAGMDQAGPAGSDVSGWLVPFAGLFSPAARPISASMDRYIRTVGMVIRGLAHQGNVLIVGRGGQILLRNHPNAVHILVVAPVRFRVDRVMASHSLNKRVAQARVRTSDRARSDYLRRYHDVAWLDPDLYDLVVNTGRVSVDTAVELIIAVHRAHQTPAERPGAEKEHDAGEN